MKSYTIAMFVFQWSFNHFFAEAYQKDQEEHAL